MSVGAEPTVVTDGLIDYVVNRIAFSVRKYVLKKEVSIILYGYAKNDKGEDTTNPAKLICIKSFEVLCRKAREVLHERCVEGTKVARQESIGFYESMIADPLVSEKSKLKARENLDKIHAVFAPDSDIPTIPISGTIKVINIAASKLTLEEKKSLLKESRGGSSS